MFGYSPKNQTSSSSEQWRVYALALTTERHTWMSGHTAGNRRETPYPHKRPIVDCAVQQRFGHRQLRHPVKKREAVSDHRSDVQANKREEAALATETHMDVRPHHRK